MQHIIIPILTGVIGLITGFYSWIYLTRALKIFKEHRPELSIAEKAKLPYKEFVGLDDNFTSHLILAAISILAFVFCATELF